MRYMVASALELIGGLTCAIGVTLLIYSTFSFIFAPYHAIAFAVLAYIGWKIMEFGDRF